MKKKGQIVCVWCLCLLILLTGCGMKRAAAMEKQEVAFTVMNPDELPEELTEIIEENKQSEIRLTYEDAGSMYLVRGYGRQKTGGYSIAVNEVYQTKDGICVDTSLIGPPGDRQIQDEASYPYLVLKMEAREAEVVFK